MELIVSVVCDLWLDMAIVMYALGWFWIKVKSPISCVSSTSIGVSIILIVYVH